MPVGGAVALFCDHLAEILHPVEVVGDVLEFLLGGASFELSRDLLGCPVAGGGAEEVADSGELFFGQGRPLLLLYGFGDDFLGGTHTVDGGLGGLCLMGAWYSGRSQRMWPLRSSSARWALRATRFSRICSPVMSAQPQKHPFMFY